LSYRPIYPDRSGNRGLPACLRNRATWRFHARCEFFRPTRATSKRGLRQALVHDVADPTRPDGAAALANRESLALLHGHRRNQLDVH